MGSSRWWQDVLRGVLGSVGKWIGLLLASLLPPTAVVLDKGLAYLVSSIPVPGWVVLLVLWLTSLLFASLFIILRLYLSLRRRSRPTLTVVPVGGEGSLCWEDDPFEEEDDVSDRIYVHGMVRVTNMTKSRLAILETILLLRGRRWRVIPVMRTMRGGAVYPPIPPGKSSPELVEWELYWPMARKGQTFRAKIGLVDHLGNEHWTRWRDCPYRNPFPDLDRATSKSDTLPSSTAASSCCEAPATSAPESPS